MLAGDHKSRNVCHLKKNVGLFNEHGMDLDRIWRHIRVSYSKSTCLRYGVFNILIFHNFGGLPNMIEKE